MPDKLPPLDRAVVAELLWKESEHRHGIIWRTFELWGTAAILCFLGPFFYQEIEFSVFSPLVGIIISVIGGWHVHAESERWRKVREKYFEILGFNFAKIYHNPVTLYERSVMIATSQTIARIMLWILPSLGLGSFLISISSALEFEQKYVVLCVLISGLSLLLGIFIAFRALWKKAVAN